MTITKSNYETIIEMEEFHPLFGDSNGGIQTRQFDATQQLSLPTVTLSAASRRKPEPKRCHMARSLKIFVCLFPLYFYRQINDVSVSTDMFSSPIVRNDYTSVRSIHDLDSQRVAQWCNRRVYECPCQDPLVANPRDSETAWQTKHAKNVQVLTDSMSGSKNGTGYPDVVFYGDGLVAGWNKYPAVFDSFFKVTKGGKFNAIALGIADDRSPNLLWRLQNGEMPDDYTEFSTEPAVMWLMIGSQDLGLTSCAPELVIIGILRIVEELLIRTTTANVVINGILPRTFNRDGFVNKGGLLNPSTIGIPTGIGTTAGSNENGASGVFNSAGSTDGTTVASTTKSLWQDIQVVNEELKLYARYRHRVSYFDHNKKLFEDPSATGKDLRIDPRYMEDHFHLTQKGYQQWGAAIAKRLSKLIVLPYRNMPDGSARQKAKTEEGYQEDSYFGDDKDEDDP
ncbi:unnamed protein product [Cylindrotheca closterium]|uniref:SGNH hydrolase-type esterase domain-containing protein n=1 Tax=Cylindrotheca closterium TaxID=2856 RepID=A0AAD2CNJ9_9STRA|nr:unnamed protein product [Cylindrotheca closterium]